MEFPAEDVFSFKISRKIYIQIIQKNYFMTINTFQLLNVTSGTSLLNMSQLCPGRIFWYLNVFIHKLIHMSRLVVDNAFMVWMFSPKMSQLTSRLSTKNIFEILFINSFMRAKTSQQLLSISQLKCPGRRFEMLY